MTGHNYNQTDNSTSSNITNRFWKLNRSHDKGVTPAGRPAPPVLSRDGFQRHGSDFPVVEAVTHYELESDALKNTITLLNEKVRKLESEVKSLQQGQDFRSYQVEAGTPHDRLQGYLRDIRHEIVAWSRVIERSLLKLNAKANVSALGEELDKVLGPGKARELINNEDSCQEAPITNSDIFAAIASNIIVEQAVMNPLASCTPEFQTAMNSKVYEMMLSDGSSLVNRKAAKMWQSACLKMYDLSDEFGSNHEKEMARERSIDDIMLMVSKALRIEIHGQAHQPKLRRSISRAVDIGKELGQLLSGLVPINKSWLHEHADGDGYISTSTMGSRIEPRSPPHEGKVIVQGKVALVLFPGLLKYGSDDGECWDSWTVLTPAKIHLMDEQIEDISPEAPDHHAYQPPAKMARGKRAMERNGRQDIGPKPKQERLRIQANRTESPTRAIPYPDEYSGLDYPW